MNNKFIVTGTNQDEVVVSSEKGELKVFSNENLREKLKLKNNIEILTNEYNSLESEYADLKKAETETTADAKQKTKGMIIIGGVGIVFFSAITSFSVFSAILSAAIALVVGVDVLAIQTTVRKELKNIKAHLEVIRLNIRLASDKKYQATEALIKLLVREEKFKEEFIPNREYIVDDNYDYVFTKAEYVEPEKPLSLERIKRVCREKLDKKRR